VKRDEKAKVVADLHERAKKAVFFVLTDYRGLNVAKISELRRGLREASAEYQVVKNKLLARAAEGTELEKLKDDFVGPSALVLSYNDPVEPSKVLVKFAEDNGVFEIRSGLLRGQKVDADKIKALSKLPPRDVLLAQLLSAMNAVPQGLVQALADAPRRMVNVLSAIRDQKEAA